MDMEAKDTVMTKEQIDALWLEHWNMVDNLPPSFEVWKRVYPLAQAEISFKAGMDKGFIISKVTDPVLSSEYEHEELNRRAKAYLDSVKQEGIKEVVEWIHAHGFMMPDDKGEWESQLKKWGIE